MRKTLSSIGSSLGIIIDKPILEALGIEKNSILDMSIEGSALVIRAEPKRAASSREELEEWARSLVVRLSAHSDEALAEDLAAEIERFEQILPLFTNIGTPSARRPNAYRSQELRSWMKQIVHQMNAQRPAPPKPILTRQVALALLEDLSDARDTFREVTAARPYAGASPSFVAGVIWFLLAQGYVEVHADSSTIRPTLERFRNHGRVPESPPDSLADSLKNGVTLLRMTPLGGEYLHELRTSEREVQGSPSISNRLRPLK